MRSRIESARRRDFAARMRVISKGHSWQLVYFSPEMDAIPESRPDPVTGSACAIGLFRALPGGMTGQMARYWFKNGRMACLRARCQQAALAGGRADFPALAPFPGCRHDQQFTPLWHSTLTAALPKRCQSASGCRMKPPMAPASEVHDTARLIGIVCCCFGQEESRHAANFPSISTKTGRKIALALQDFTTQTSLR